MIEDAIKRSRVLFNSGWYCAESVLIAVAEHQGIRCTCVSRIATGLCSGLSRSGGMCGALMGAILGISLVLGRSDTSDPVDDCYLATQELRENFETTFGSESCHALTGCHLGTTEGRERFADEGIHERCLEFVAEATRFALEAVADSYSSSH